jgi:predicted nucleic-acid-binding Zn-ribbon protein
MPLRDRPGGGSFLTVERDQEGVNPMQGLRYACPKCRHTEYEISEFRATGGFWTKIFDVQTKRFTTVTCAQCRYTELFKADSSKLGNVFDFFTNG